MQLYTNAKQLHTANANECEDSGMTFATITSETTTRNANLQLTSGKMQKVFGDVPLRHQSEM